MEVVKEFLDGSERRLDAQSTGAVAELELRGTTGLTGDSGSVDWGATDGTRG